MINLIPPNARKLVKREYWTRVLSVWMLLLASALIIVTLLKIPAYVLVRDQLHAFADTFAEAASSEQQFTAAASEIEQANTISRLLVQEDRTKFSDIIATISAIATPGIRISNQRLARNENDILLIVISGEAATRQELAAFKNNIELHEQFETAELPISNLAKDIDIPFQITIIPAINESEL